jgi:hypothetical protein
MSNNNNVLLRTKIPEGEAIQVTVGNPGNGELTVVFAMVNANVNDEPGSYESSAAVQHSTPKTTKTGRVSGNDRSNSVARQKNAPLRVAEQTPSSNSKKAWFGTSTPTKNTPSTHVSQRKNKKKIPLGTTTIAEDDEKVDYNLSQDAGQFHYKMPRYTTGTTKQRTPLKGLFGADDDDDSENEVLDKTLSQMDGLKLYEESGSDDSYISD